MRITMGDNRFVKDIFSDYILSCKARGLSDKTIISYQGHFDAISKYLDTEADFASLNNFVLE